MSLESAQLMSATVREKLSHMYTDEDFSNMGIYKSSHLKHPSRLWIAESFANFTWLYHHAKQICRLYTADTTKQLACQPVIEKCYELIKDCYLNNTCKFDYEGHTSIKLAMPENLKQQYGRFNGYHWVADWYFAVQAYRHYINTKQFKPLTKSDKEAGIMRRPTWKNGNTPYWYIANFCE